MASWTAPSSKSRVAAGWKVTPPLPWPPIWPNRARLRSMTSPSSSPERSTVNTTAAPTARIAHTKASW